MTRKVELDCVWRNAEQALAAALENTQHDHTPTGA
jgi:hypothetical protein